MCSACNQGDVEAAGARSRGILRGEKTSKNDGKCASWSQAHGMGTCKSCVKATRRGVRSVGGIPFGRWTRYNNRDENSHSSKQPRVVRKAGRGSGGSEEAGPWGVTVLVGDLGAGGGVVHALGQLRREGGDHEGLLQMIWGGGGGPPLRAPDTWRPTGGSRCWGRGAAAWMPPNRAFLTDPRWERGCSLWRSGRLG